MTVEFKSVLLATPAALVAKVLLNANTAILHIIFQQENVFPALILVVPTLTVLVRILHPAAVIIVTFVPVTPNASTARVTSIYLLKTQKEYV
jgi:hypothetical protein